MRPPQLAASFISSQPTMSLKVIGEKLAAFLRRSEGREWHKADMSGLIGDFRSWGVKQTSLSRSSMSCPRSPPLRRGRASRLCVRLMCMLSLHRTQRRICSKTEGPGR